MDCGNPGFPVFHHLPEFAQTHVHWVSDAILPSYPLSSPSPTFNLSQHQGLCQESVLRIRWPKYWSFNFSISPSNEYSGQTVWISLLSKVLSRAFSNTTVQKCQFLGSQLSLWSNSHIHTWLLKKTIALTRQIFVGKVMLLLFNKLSRLVITFLPRSKCLNFMAAVTICSDFGAQKIKSDTVSTVCPSISHEVMGPDAMIFVFWMLSFKPTFSLSSLLSSRGFLVPLHFLP